MILGASGLVLVGVTAFGLLTFVPAICAAAVFAAPVGSASAASLGTIPVLIASPASGLLAVLGASKFCVSAVDSAPSLL